MLMFSTEVEELEITLVIDEFNFYRGSPGQLNGPPENCYPPESDEVEPCKWHIEVDGVRPKDLAELEAMLMKKYKSTIEDVMFDEVATRAEDL